MRRMGQHRPLSRPGSTREGLAMERSPARHSPTRQHPDAAAERQPSSDGDDGEAAAKAVASYLTVFDFSAVKGNPRGTANAVAQPISPRWVAVTLVALLLLYALVEVVVVQPMEEEERLVSGGREEKRRGPYIFISIIWT